MSSILESNTLPRVEDLELEFGIDVLDAQFNHGGWYYLDITLHNSFTTDYSEVKMRLGDGEWEVKREVRTDSTKQEENAPLSFFKNSKFRYRLPKGFCKNDKSHEVYLVVEAFTSDAPSGKGRKVGEGKFAIYPRPNAPRMKMHVQPGENYYNFTSVMSLLRTHSTDNIQMHCGRIRSNFSLHELVPPKPQKRYETPPPRKTDRSNVSPVPSPTPRPSRITQYPTPTLGTVVQGSRPPDRATFRQAKPPKTASSWGEDNLSLDLNFPKSPPLPPAAEGRKIPESPLKEDDKHTYATDTNYRHVSSNGKQEIEVILHGASSLPLNSDGMVPLPYGVVKLQKDEDGNKKGGVSTHTAVRPTHTPSWEEKVVLNIDDKTADDETLVISVGDASSHKGLVNYRIPVNNLTPFHQYHLELNMPAQGIPSGVKAYATITRKVPTLPKDMSSPNYLALEVLLMNVQLPIKNPVGPLIAVARVVPDYYNYKSDNLLSHPRTAGVTMQNVTFPSAHPTNFIVTERNKHGHPQLSLPGRPDKQPRWNHPYLFVDRRDKATLFTPGAALVIEYYVASVAMSEQFWRMQSPVAFSAILMDEEMYKHLISDKAKNGLRINGVPMQGSEMTTENGQRPTVGVILRLLTTETPDAMVSVSNYEDIPTLDLFPPSEAPGYFRSESADILHVDTGMDSDRPLAPAESPLSPARTPGTPPHQPQKREPAKSRYVLQKVKKRPLSPIKDGEMPPISAMESVLPEYQYIFQPGTDDQAGRRTPTRAAPHHRDDDLDEPQGKNSMVLIEHQANELGNYRGAVHKMGGDILALRNQIRDLENVNSNLRRDLANYNDSRRLMIDSAELDNLTKPEVLSRYAALKQTLSSQTSDLKGYKDKLQHVQNELIKKNDETKNYLKIQKAHAAQLAMIQKLQEKLKKTRKLEEACKAQEGVIAKMEDVIAKQNRDRSKLSKDKAAQEANEALLQENKRLRGQIDELKLQMRTSGGNPNDDMEKMELYQSLERANGRIESLEKQFEALRLVLLGVDVTKLANNSREWGKERADLRLRLNEAEHGFGRSAGMVLHDYPVFNDHLGKSSVKRPSPLGYR